MCESQKNVYLLTLFNYLKMFYYMTFGNGSKIPATEKPRYMCLLV